ncbi:LOW QUALITY PROTEIN: protein O-GlcNAcase-like [Pollicipes pollicipes]|uniref:LOW QUALITY PROTEIN: protein O-GlcNAcase-like n=1 Tax=Pollicipes pollicipes TaxID=41117 RepID=UPI0018849291|nr:LOW QUALITY PROTEIN: protein O-GlcNAcase-like [Pollicipes pollicipes]
MLLKSTRMASSSQADGESAQVGQCSASIPNGDSVLDSNKNYVNDQSKFISGVVEGFYGRPWTAEQRKELFGKMKRWGMTSYLYAPKDDYKHRAYWREMYTVEEAEHLTSLIRTAHQHGVTFIYGLSPGMDITYSSQKEMAALKRKLDQVSQFGCVAFALLFDDIDPEMREDDKQVFQSFAHAQVTVTNEMNDHLSRPQFLFCPTQYCATRAIPTVTGSEYLRTIGSKLAPNIDIMWTGPKVVSKVLSVESIEELREVLKRPPVIWDNLHANDYDQKRLYLGPYSGRPVELRSRLRGVLTNPNCEYGVNYVAIRTLAHWAQCRRDGEPPRPPNDPLSADIRLETESEEGAEPHQVPPDVYHPRHALRMALREWLPEFNKARTAHGALQQRVLTITPGALEGPAPVPIPGINTCMATTSTVTTDTTSVPAGTVKQLQAIAEAQIIKAEEVVGVTGPVLNSLADAEKIVVPSTPGELAEQPAEPGPPCEPMECNSAPADAADKVEPAAEAAPGEPMAVESGPARPPDMQLEPGPDGAAAPADDSPASATMSVEEEEEDLTEDDLMVMSDLFYLPFEHGAAGLRLLKDFQWLKSNCSLVVPYARKGKIDESLPPEAREWYDRAAAFDAMAKRVKRLLKRLFLCENRSLLYDLYPYIWDMESVLSQLNGYVRWLAMGVVCDLASSHVEGNYTWFTRGWKESFMSGDNEPWIFRGGLTGDLERLLPLDNASDLMANKSPEHPLTKVCLVRPYRAADEQAVRAVWHQCSGDTHPSFQQYPELSADRWVAPFLLLQPQHCLVLEDDDETVVAFAAAAPDARQLHRQLAVSWLEEMRLKYPMPDTPPARRSPAQNCIAALHGEDALEPPACLLERFKGCMRLAVLPSVADSSLVKRLAACSMAVLRTCGCFGAHVRVPADDMAARELLTKVTFTPVDSLDGGDYVFYGRNF